MKKFMSNLTNKYIKLEASGNTGFKFHLYRLLIKLYKWYETKKVSNKWFWFYGCFHLPPYWWRTMTFKVITVSMFLMSMTIILGYFFLHNNAEQIVAEIEHSEVSVVVASEGDNTESEVEESDDRPKMIINEPFTVEESESLLHYDLSDALNKNSDTVGWIEIPSCGISYPVVQGADNDFYLNHDFNKNYTFHGWVFQDCRFSVDKNMKNNVIYGHNLIAGGMFSSLSSILSMKQKVYVKYQATYETFLYEVVSVYVTPPVLSYIQMSFSDEEFKNFEDAIKKNNQWKYAPDYEFTAADKFLTLSTCYGDDRLAVHCKLVDSALLTQ